MDMDLEELMDSKEYNREKQTIRDSLDLMGKPLSFTYTILDFFLNGKQYDTFSRCIGNLRRLLYGEKTQSIGELQEEIQSTFPLTERF